jgi:CBS domain-containing protein
VKTLGTLAGGRDIHFVESDATVLDTVRLLVDRQIGAVPVLEKGRLVGIFSERDLMTRVVVKGADPAGVPVRDVMTRDILVGRVEEPIADCRFRMKQARIRHLPVVDGDRLVAFISFRDLMQMEISEKSEELEYLNEYIHFKPPWVEETGES